MGISHPAGFPVYNLLAKAFTFVPLGSVAFKVNLFSATAACLALGCLYWTAVRFLVFLHARENPGRFAGPALLAAGYLAVSQPFWFNASVAEVYSLHAFFVSLLVLLFLYWREKGDFRYLHAAALVYGLSSGNHATVAFFLPAVLVLFFSWTPAIIRSGAGQTPGGAVSSGSAPAYAMDSNPPLPPFDKGGMGGFDKGGKIMPLVRHLGICVLFFLVGFSVYAYLPVRSHAEPSFDWGNPETAAGFLYQITDRKDAGTHFKSMTGDRREAGGQTGSFADSAKSRLGAVFHKIPLVVWALLTDLEDHLSPVSAVGFLAGAFLCWRKSRPLFFFLVLVTVFNVAFFVKWGRESFFPSYVVATLFTAAAIHYVLDLPFLRGGDGPRPGQRDAGVEWPSADGAGQTPGGDAASAPGKRPEATGHVSTALDDACSPSRPSPLDPTRTLARGGNIRGDTPSGAFPGRRGAGANGLDSDGERALSRAIRVRPFRSGAFPGRVDWRRIAWALLVLLIPWSIFKNYYAVDRSQHYLAEPLAAKIYLTLPDRAVFVPGLSWFNYYYSQDVARLRDDVTAVSAWDLLSENPPAWLTPRRFPDLDLPDAARRRFNTREQIAEYIEETFRGNGSARPVVVEQNETFYEQTTLAGQLRPYRNALLLYDPSSGPGTAGIRDPGQRAAGANELDSAGEQASSGAIWTRPSRAGAEFEEFKKFLEEDLAQPGVAVDQEWLTLPYFLIHSFRMYYHDTRRYSEEREVLRLMNEFLGKRDAAWQFQMADNLVLDGKLEEAGRHVETLRNVFAGSPEAWMAEGLLARAGGAPEDSVQPFLKAAALSPGDYRPRYELAEAYRQMGEPERALPELDAAFKMIKNVRELSLVRQARISTGSTKESKQAN
ncbi:MAG: DUF2723 domain-containing protein [Nitrospinae bacterium]|nr:DUF2723 domain-containing protein [Nitrospinota bacterium]